MLIRLKNANVEAKADRIANQHGCSINIISGPPLPPHGNHPKGTRSLDPQGAYDNGRGERTKECLAALKDAGCIYGVEAAPKQAAPIWAVYNRDTGDLISRHNTEEAARTKASRVAGSPERDTPPLARRHNVTTYIPTAVAQGVRGAAWHPYHQHDEWHPGSGWEKATASDE